MGYRAKYEKFYGIKLPKTMDVHHIDFNHNNDDIRNLIALPRKLHQRYHKLLYTLGGYDDSGRVEMNIRINKTAIASHYECEILKELYEVINEIHPYVVDCELRWVNKFMQIGE